jgi:hypothetical protein
MNSRANAQMFPNPKESVLLIKQLFICCWHQLMTYR